jgi:hypothetical protein
MTQRPKAKWAQVISRLREEPGEWLHVADNAGPSTVQRLRELGAEVTTELMAPRSNETTYSRYKVFARWPTPQTELERVSLALTNLTEKLEAARHDVTAAEAEYNSAKQILNRNSYRRKQAREKYEPLLEQHDQLTALLNRLKTEKD